MKNYLINSRYGINKNILLLIKKLKQKRKNIFLNKIKINNNYIFNFCIKKNFFLFKNYINFKIVIICGGDGSIVNNFKIFFNKKNFLKCLNFGNLGFLTNNYLNKNYIVKNNIGFVFIKNNIFFSLIFLNEVILKNTSLRIKIKSKIFISDGIIITTTNGSSAYFFSINKIQFNLEYLSLNLICEHTNSKFIFFFKKIKIKILKKIILIIDFNQYFFFEKTILFFFLKKKNIFLNDLKFKFYDK
ncbi:NAD(+)/NADH kinase [Candidatus Carsonella ruddii]|uniref:hypothetical protein n=1 Tax=Carsonella ruddii TaxID=114186 RepID=UPI00247AC0E0|nr:hypothetical protein [Candidatus Carsonella ruddii]WGS66574.1 hypothetical protein MEJ66_00590 [Candidatus Carsonella ruddii]WGS66772.1 hypothetical protein MEJ62_00575 [Candidatus Carsonella ruddii]WGS66963.1 hypothetical protein MEJ60_00575 [Candidatus Carsonella ruddii]WMC18170.1 MAG: hypothetical protein NU472_00585 [Candidatus Carsonella ruddii]WMC18364.1 MAG: hypothetical protein NU470_00585 [Candidatus Carsonella ruddii]